MKLRARHLSNLPFSTIIAGVLAFSVIAPAFAHPHEQGDEPSPTPTATLQGESRAVITSPGVAERVFGTVQVIGSALDPEFEYYILQFAPDPTPSDVGWADVQPSVVQQVSSGVLGAWDTAGLDDGRYILRLVMYRAGGADEDAVVYEVRVEVSNATPTPMPTATPTPPTDLFPGIPTLGPSPTPLIQQPPTSTPRPTLQVLATEVPADEDDESSPFDTERMVRAARRGVLFTVAFFALLGLYWVVRAGFRGTLAEFVAELRRDILRPLADELFRRRRK